MVVTLVVVLSVDVVVFLVVEPLSGSWNRRSCHPDRHVDNRSSQRSEVRFRRRVNGRFLS